MLGIIVTKKVSPAGIAVDVFILQPGEQVDAFVHHMLLLKWIMASMHGWNLLANK